MPAKDVSAKYPKDKTSVTVKFNMPDSVEGLVKKFGEEIVLAHATSSMTVALQGGLRSQLKEKKKPAEIQAWAGEWKPGMRTPGKSFVEKFKEKVPNMTPEQRKELLKTLQEANK